MLDHMPDDVILKILLLCDPWSVGSVAATCKAIRGSLKRNKSPIWREMFRYINKPAPKRDANLQRCFAKAYNSTNRCHFCKTTGLRRKYGEFGGIYLCQWCMRRHCKLAYHLIHTYHLPKARVHELPCVKRQFWRNSFCDVTIRIILKSDADRLCMELHGVAIERRLEILNEPAVRAKRLRDERRAVHLQFASDAGLPADVISDLPAFNANVKVSKPPLSREEFGAKVLPALRLGYERWLQCIADKEAWISRHPYQEIARDVIDPTFRLFRGEFMTQINSIETEYESRRVAFEASLQLQAPWDAMFLKKFIGREFGHSSTPESALRSFVMSLSKPWADRRCGCALRCVHCSYTKEPMQLRVHLWDRHRVCGSDLDPHCA
jgi:hypothetical protein